MTDAAVQIVLFAEEQYRESVVRHYHWRVQRKAELEEEDRRRKVEAEKAEVERLKHLEEARINRILGDAAAFQQAAIIRTYVETIRRSQSTSPTISVEELEGWSRWALAQADWIDPSLWSHIFVRDTEGANQIAKASVRETPVWWFPLSFVATPSMAWTTEREILMRIRF